MTEPMGLVLVVEDDPQMRRFLRNALSASGRRVLEATSASEAAMLVASHNPELVLLDLGLPDRDGLELTGQLRGERYGMPIIVLSARGREQDKVAALDAGADDYLTKPFGVNELLARMRAALRRARQRGQTAQESLDLGTLRIDFDKHVVSRDGQEIRLTPIEHKLLTLLAENAGKVLTHRQILQEVWGPAYASHVHYVRVHMAELRKKVERDPTRPRLIVTEQGVGYRLRDPSDPDEPRPARERP